MSMWKRVGRKNTCACQDAEVKRYLNKISGPLADRIAIHIEVGHEVSDSNSSFATSIRIFPGLLPAPKSREFVNGIENTLEKTASSRDHR